MISVITGDIIKSRKTPAETWLKVLKKELNKLGDTPRQWEVYRGDSFQAEVKDAAVALTVAIKLKAALKSIKGVDVRIAIGIGDKTYSAKHITESNGSAFVYSGELMGELKSRKVNMAVKSSNVKFDDEMNLYLKLALVTMDKWTTTAAETMHATLEYPDKLQKELGKLLKKPQNAVSTRLKRARSIEINEVLRIYQIKVAELK
jgi:hypothetical protein